MSTSPECASPLDWPADQERTPAHKQREARFRKESGIRGRSLTLTEAMVRVGRELEAFGTVKIEGYRYWRADCSDATLSANLRVRRSDDRWHAQQANPDDPGAVLRYRLDDEDFVIALDGYDRVADNIAAIAACLSALRALERHGSNIAGRFSRGLRALPAPGEVSGHWSAVLGVSAGAQLEEVRTAFARLARRHHPDTGDEPSADRLQEFTRAWDEARRDLRAAA